MSHGDPRLVGAWQRSGAPPCAARYASTLRMEASGLYFGQAEVPGEFTWWDGGTWRVPAPGQLTLSVANDALVTYHYALAGELLSITDPQGCSFDYHRVG